MVGQGHEYNEQLELVIDMLEGIMQEEGYKTLRFSNTNNKHSTTTYDCLVLRDREGKEFTINFDESFRYNDFRGKWERTNYIAE